MTSSRNQGFVIIVRTPREDRSYRRRLKLTIYGSSAAFVAAVLAPSPIGALFGSLFS